jgi:tetratricopeptide (TPR) repeat protein
MEVSESVINELVRRSDGNPLFLEEMTKFMIANLTGGNLESEFLNNTPVSLSGLLMAKLDMLEDEKDLIKLASVIGSEFSYLLIKEITPYADDELADMLNKLINAEVLYKKGIYPDIKYYFKHCLIQETAYKSLLRSEKKAYHKKIADVLEDIFSDSSELQPEVIAHHMTQAGLIEKAIRYLHIGAVSLIKHSAYTEATNHLRKAISLLDELDEFDTNRLTLELELLISLGGVLRVIEGYSSLEAERTYERALDLTNKLGKESESFKVYRGLGGYYLATADYKIAQEISQKSLELSRKLSEPVHMIQAHYMLGAINFCQANLDDALMHTNAGISLYNPDKHSSSAYLYGHDPAVGCSFWNACSLWFMGLPDQAIERANNALKHAESLSHNYSIANSLILISVIHFFRREPVKAYENAIETLRISKEKGYEIFHAMGNLFEGGALMDIYDTDECILKIREGLDRWNSIGAELFNSVWYAMKALAYCKLDQLDDAKLYIDKAHKFAIKKNELFYLPEILRIKGETLSRYNNCDDSDVHKLLNKAIEISASQNSKILELRAKASLFKLMKIDEDKSNVKKLLKKSYDTFTEGFDTVDLAEVRSLIR